MNSFQVVVVAFVAWMLFRCGRSMYHFFHRSSLRKSGYTVRGTVVRPITILNLNSESEFKKVTDTRPMMGNFTRPSFPPPICREICPVWAMSLKSTSAPPIQQTRRPTATPSHPTSKGKERTHAIS